MCGKNCHKILSVQINFYSTKTVETTSFFNDEWVCYFLFFIIMIYTCNICVILLIIEKRLYLTLFDLATILLVFTVTWKNTTWIFSDFFETSLTTLYTHWIIAFSKRLIFNHFLLGLWISKILNIKIFFWNFEKWT